MTVEELIERLKTFDPQAAVFVEAYDVVDNVQTLSEVRGVLPQPSYEEEYTPAYLVSLELDENPPIQEVLDSLWSQPKKGTLPAEAKG